MSKKNRRLKGATLGLLVAALVLGTSPTIAQDEGIEGSVTITGYQCPASATVDAFEPSECQPTTTGFDFSVTSNLGVAQPLTIADATFDGTSYRLELGRAAEADSSVVGFGNWAISVVPGDGFSNDYVVLGDAVVDVRDGRYSFLTTTDAPDAVLSVYIFPAPTPTPAPGDPDSDGEPAATESATVVSESTGRFVRLVEGSCEGDATDQLNDDVADLGELTIPIADPVGVEAAIGVETIYSVVDLTLDSILAEDHSIVVLEGDQNDAAVLACGGVGGAADAQGAIAVGLAEVAESGFVGIAYLAPTGDGVGLSIFVAQGLTKDESDAA